MTDLAVFFKDLPINPTISENSKEKICVENFLAKNRKAPNKKQTCRKKRKKLNTIRQNKIRVKCPCRLKSAISRLNDRNPLFKTFRHKKFSAKCLFAFLM